MVAELATAAVVLVAAVAEMLHARRIRRVAALAFGPGRKGAAWVVAGPLIRIAATAAICWGLLTLIGLAPKVHEADTVAPEDYRHVVMVLDVSPSMQLDDAGPERNQSRMKRASDVMESFFKRVAIQQFRLSVIAVYTSAKPVVVDTTDLEVVRNILNELPMHYAFKSGKTDIFSGLEEAIRVARPWKPRSTTVILVSDGDTVPTTGMPQMPPSVRDVVVVGIGDPVAGKFIDGRQSRQDTSTLRQIATRLRGTYHNGNQHHLSTELLKQITQTTDDNVLERLTRREYALLSCGIGAVLLALLPLLLHFFGTRWRPGRLVDPAPNAVTS